MSAPCVGCGKVMERAFGPSACGKCIERMSHEPNPTEGQVWQRRSPSGERVRIEGMNGDEVCFSDAGSCMSASIEHFRVHYCKPTIRLRIRVGVTADGNWSAFGRSIGVTAGHIYMSPTDVVGEDIGDHGPIVAWHWITAEVPMPETEHGDVAGEVERPSEGMPSDQKGSR